MSRRPKKVATRSRGSDAGASAPRSSSDVRSGSDVSQAVRFGTILALLFLALGLLLIVLALFGRGWSYLLGGIDFLAIGGVLSWALRHRPRAAPRLPPA